MVIARTTFGPMNMAYASEVGGGQAAPIDPSAEIVYDAELPDGDQDSFTAGLFAQQALQQIPKLLISAGLPMHMTDRLSFTQNEGRSFLIRSEAWQIQKHLGSGADGNVYSVRHHATGRMAALKIFNPLEWNKHGEFVRNQAMLLFSERQLLSLDEGVRIFNGYPWAIGREMVTTGGTLAMLMELVNGWTISDRPIMIGDATIPKPTDFGPVTKIQIARRILQILEQTSRAGLRMFDVKHDTFTITNGRRLRVIDLDRVDRIDTDILSSGISSRAREYTFERLRYAMLQPLSLLTFMVPDQEDFISSARRLYFGDIESITTNGEPTTKPSYTFLSIEEWFQKWKDYLNKLEESIS